MGKFHQDLQEEFLSLVYVEAFCAFLVIIIHTFVQIISHDRI
jgi:hypothetical protein